jgi:hypothetical protein
MVAQLGVRVRRWNWWERVVLDCEEWGWLGEIML